MLDRDRQYHMISLTCQIKKNDTNKLIHTIGTGSQTQKINMITERERGGGGINQEFEINIQTLLFLYKIGKQQGPTVQHR